LVIFLIVLPHNINNYILSLIDIFKQNQD
jgi:hypothetical protein